jgi:rubrerythrin
MMVSFLVGLCLGVVLGIGAMTVLEWEMPQQYRVRGKRTRHLCTWCGHPFNADAYSCPHCGGLKP